MKRVETKDQEIQLENEDWEFLSFMHRTAYRHDPDIQARQINEIHIHDDKGGCSVWNVHLKPMPEPHNTRDIEMRTWARK